MFMALKESNQILAMIAWALRFLAGSLLHCSCWGVFSAVCRQRTITCGATIEARSEPLCDGDESSPRGRETSVPQMMYVGGKDDPCPAKFQTVEYAASIIARLLALRKCNGEDLYMRPEISMLYEVVELGY